MWVHSVKIRAATGGQSTGSCNDLDVPACTTVGNSGKAVGSAVGKQWEAVGNSGKASGREV